MKAIITSLLLLAATAFAAEGRALVGTLSYRELYNRSDVIVVAKPISTKDTAEQTVLGHISPDIPVIGLSSEFEISVVLKGDNNLKKLILHHYRLANPKRPMSNGPHFASFDPKEATRFLLFLQREPDGRYAPVYNHKWPMMGQVDPALCSILKLNSPDWDQIKFADFKEWLDAKKWLDERPQSAQPQIPRGGAGNDNLFEAALNDKLEKAKALLKVNPGLVSSRYGADETPLHWAALYGHKDVAALLIENKADVNDKSTINGWAPLHYAVLGGHLDVAELLLTNKAEVNAEERSGRTPLHVAAENGYKELTALLLANKADVNAKESDGGTSLRTAAALGFNDVVEMLLANKANVNTTDKRGDTPLHVAARNGLKDVAASLLVGGADVNAKNNEGQTPLHAAAIGILFGSQTGCKEVAELLLANNADVTAKDNNGKTPLDMATLKDHLEMIKLLKAEMEKPR